MGGVVRGVGIGIIVLLVSLIFAVPPLQHLSIVVLFLILSSLLFSLAGLVNGIYAQNFDGITIVPTFVLTRLVYLGGVFYSTQALPDWWRTLTYFDPIFYLINGFRYGLMGISDIPILVSTTVLVALITILFCINWYFVKTGLGLRQ